MGDQEQSQKLFLGGLDYSSTEDSLKEYFSEFGELVDIVVMRFPDTKRSRGFGFITYSNADEANACFQNGPHTVDGKEIETKKATPREEGGGRQRGGGGGNSGGGRQREERKNEAGEPESHRKLFIGGCLLYTSPSPRD